MGWQKIKNNALLMVDERKYASLIKIEKELLTLNMPKIIANLNSYALDKLYDRDESVADDIVGDVFDKLFSGQRKWFEGSSLKFMLFGAVKSLCHNHNRKLLKSYETTVNSSNIENVGDEAHLIASKQIEFNEIRDLALKILGEHDPPPDYLEELIFDCWMNGMTKQQEIANYLPEDIIEVRKGVKRLKRKLGSVQKEFIKLGYGRE